MSENDPEGTSNGNVAPALAAARRAREEQALRAAEPPVAPPASGTPAVEDPFRLCTYATLAALAWLLSPPVVLAFFSVLGLVAYGRALRAGLLRSRCLLRDTRLTLLYLGVLAVMALTVIGLKAAAIWKAFGR